MKNRLIFVEPVFANEQKFTNQTVNYTTVTTQKCAQQIT